ncbi:MAG: NAD(P)/FAD-dependent oxidoreductase, partial [Gammaproteobacteria bacterium]|nr:NAD(P)/FAD-dependent oxidoreductase [Gammaproteobacteria bacterium]
YPGCACDVQSHLYSFSFEPNPNWSRMYAPQAEIRDYLRHCAQKYQLQSHTRFGRHVVRARFDEAQGLWHVDTAPAAALKAYMQARGLKPGDALNLDDPELPPLTTFRAPVVVSGMGGLSTPAYPNVPGLAQFQGERFHSADWNHQYDLSGKRVAVIGTGASAIQFVPEIAPLVAKLDLFQRTPPWIMPKPDRAVTPLEKAVFRQVPQAQSAMRNRIYWQLEARVIGLSLHPRLTRLAELEARRHLRKQVPNKTLRRKLTPDYALGCKRVLLSNNYLPALTRPNVEVITDGIREVRAHSIIDNTGCERPVDAIIFGTGFKAQDPLPRGAIFGRDGRDILDTWQDGAEAYKGTTIAGFPNLFMLMGPNTGLGHNSMVYMIESQIAYVLDALAHMRKHQWRSVDVRPDVQRDYNRKIQHQLQDTVWTGGGCQSWYINANGKNTTLWPGFTWQFRQRTQAFDAKAYHCEG